MAEEQELPLSERAGAVLVAVTEIELAGHGGHVEDVARRTNLPEEAVRGALEELRQRDLIREVPGDRPNLGPRYVIRTRD